MENDSERGRTEGTERPPIWADIGVNYDRPTPETDRIMARIDDSEIDLGAVRASLADMECERQSALEALCRLDRIYRAEHDEPGVRPKWLSEALALALAKRVDRERTERTERMRELIRLKQSIRNCGQCGGTGVLELGPGLDGNVYGSITCFCVREEAQVDRMIAQTEGGAE